MVTSRDRIGVPGAPSASGYVPQALASSHRRADKGGPIGGAFVRGDLAVQVGERPGVHDAFCRYASGWLVVRGTRSPSACRRVRPLEGVPCLGSSLPMSVGRGCSPWGYGCPCPLGEGALPGVTGAHVRWERVLSLGLRVPMSVGRGCSPWGYGCPCPLGEGALPGVTAAHVRRERVLSLGLPRPMSVGRGCSPWGYRGPWPLAGRAVPWPMTPRDACDPFPEANPDPVVLESRPKEEAKVHVPRRSSEPARARRHHHGWQRSLGAGPRPTPRGRAHKEAAPRP